MTYLQIAVANVAPPPPSPVAQVIPFALVGTIVGVIFARIAKRKGRNPVFWFFVGWIPFFGWFAGFYLSSLPDLDLLKRLWALEDEISKRRG